MRTVFNILGVLRYIHQVVYVHAVVQAARASG